MYFFLEAAEGKVARVCLCMCVYVYVICTSGIPQCLIIASTFNFSGRGHLKSLKYIKRN